MSLFTFGHGTADRARLLELLRAAGIRDLVDVRTAPGSRRNPDVARDEMARWLPEHGIEYRWEKQLGGWRKPPTDSPDIGLRNRSFGGYAAHMRTRDFLDAVRDVLNGARDRDTTVFCSESVWWRLPVLHLMHDGRLHEHRPTDVVRGRADGLLIYDAAPAP